MLTLVAVVLRVLTAQHCMLIAVITHTCHKCPSSKTDIGNTNSDTHVMSVMPEHSLMSWTMQLLYSISSMQDLEYLIEKCVDPSKADFAVVCGVQVSFQGATKVMRVQHCTAHQATVLCSSPFHHLSA